MAQQVSLLKLTKAAPPTEKILTHQNKPQHLSFGRNINYIGHDLGTILRACLVDCSRRCNVMVIPRV